MTRGIAEDVIAILIAEGVATAKGTDIFYDHQPDVDSCITVRDDPSEAEIHGEIIQFNVNILVRDPNVDTARTKAFLVFTTLRAYSYPYAGTEVEIYGAIVVNVPARLVLFPEEKRRFEYTQNHIMKVR